MAGSTVRSDLPRLDWVTVVRKGIPIRMPYCFRPGTNGPSLIFIHGLGGAKENFQAVFQSAALAHCDLLTLDLPGTGLAEFDQAVCPDVSALADLCQLVWTSLIPGPAFVIGASMGGLIAQLLFRRHGTASLQGFVSIEGNLTPEDCMFSRPVAAISFEELSGTLYDKLVADLLTSPYAGDRMAAHNMALNLDPRAFHRFSFETVAESDSGRLLDEFLNLRVPRLFLYGDRNRGLSYLPRLLASDVEVREISESAHFLFYDNPVMMCDEIAGFVDKHHGRQPGVEVQLRSRVNL